MVLYEVNLVIQNEALQAYKLWLGEHVKEMLEMPGFIKAKIYEGVEPRPDSGVLVVHYFVASREALNHYFDQHAAKMRAQGLQRFAGQFVATRRVLEGVAL